MEKFNLIKTPDGDKVKVNLNGTELLRAPIYNKGVGFTAEERRRFGIEGMLPPQHNDIEAQVDRTYHTICFNKDPIGRNIDLGLLQNRNEVLFYRLLRTHLEELMPVVYTPTVGAASHFFSHVYRRARGIFITPEYAGRIEQVLRDSAPFSDVELMVVTDNEAVLGIGDQGIGGMAISIGKLSLYCVGAGIHPARTLPISLDVGTDNQELLDDPVYLGWRQHRLRGDAYLAIIDEFVEAVRTVFPKAVIQWEDFHKDIAFQVLDRHRNNLPSFNDDIQGTGAVAAAAMHAASRISGKPFSESRTVIHGAGAAGVGIARQIRRQLHQEGVDGDELKRAIIALDSRGVLSEDRDDLDDNKREFAWPAEWLHEIGLASEDRRNLAQVVDAFKGNVLIGTSGQAGSFAEEVVRTAARHSRHPVILPMSNPTDISEATPADIMKWTDGSALVATGSPFDPVEVGGEKRRIGQANNVFVFPGIGLGTIVSGATEITGSMIGASSTALAHALEDDTIGERCLMPKVNRLWDICGAVGLAVAKQAIADGVATFTDVDALEQRVNEYRWKPEYPEILKEGD
ncbi:MAG TPA: NAD-dependent malic enzyme [Woeseiaceae bacterium]|nr:NAD-dependent malic enzyme [Woeseiaceae bacterium]